MSTAISIVVPCYQVEDCLPNCYESIVAQTFNNYEIILVDDGSTDKTSALCDTYSQQNNKVFVIHKENGGLSDARNAGLKIATGRYVCFVDSDDYLHPEYLKILYKTMLSSNADIVVCGYKKTTVYHDSVDQDSIKLEIETYSSEIAIRELILSDKLMNYAWNKLYRIELFNEIKYPIGKRWEDIGTTYKLFDISETIVYISTPLYFYVQREGSISRSNILINSIDAFELLKERYDYLRKKYPGLNAAQRTQLCVVCYECWSFLQTYRVQDTDELKKAEECIQYLNNYGKAILKEWTGFKSEKAKIVLYFYCKPVLKLIINAKRRLSHA